MALLLVSLRNNNKQIAHVKDAETQLTFQDASWQGCSVLGRGVFVSHCHCQGHAMWSVARHIHTM
jgi:hypothetical protein